MIPPLALATRNRGYGMRRDPASGPAKMRSSAMNRPKNTAQAPYLVKTRSASATCPGPKCRGNLRPSQSNSFRPNQWPR